MKNEKEIWLQQFLNKNKHAQIALTFTLKQLLRHENGLIEHLNRDAASQNTKHFLNLLNRQIYGNKWKKKGQLKVTSVIEDGGVIGLEKRMHVHMAISFPFAWDYSSEFQHLRLRYIIEDCWGKTRWGYSEFDYTPITDIRGWFRYLIKEGPEAIDLLNCYW